MPISCRPGGSIFPPASPRSPSWRRRDGLYSRCESTHHQRRARELDRLRAVRPRHRARAAAVRPHAVSVQPLSRPAGRGDAPRGPRGGRRPGRPARAPRPDPRPAPRGDDGRNRVLPRGAGGLLLSRHGALGGVPAAPPPDPALRRGQRQRRGAPDPAAPGSPGGTSKSSPTSSTPSASPPAVPCRRGRAGPSSSATTSASRISCPPSARRAGAWGSPSTRSAPASDRPSETPRSSWAPTTWFSPSGGRPSKPWPSAPR